MTNYLRHAERYETTANNAAETLDRITVQWLHAGENTRGKLSDMTDPLIKRRDSYRRQAAWSREMAYRTGETTVAPWAYPTQPSWRD